ncbi:MAG: glycosyltransferase family 9 protein [Anaerolineaceae bacterium]|nr:glycosyltransferase family 9 protein [Anaerolineaceae bacterium]
MDREALVIRNQAMTEAFHSTPLKHQARRALLRMASHFPIPNGRRTHTDRILLIRPDHLGDVLLTAPAIHALKSANPQLEIHALVGPWSADVMANFPEVDLVLTLPFPGFSRTAKENLRSPYQLAVSTAAHLRRIGYGCAIIMRPDHWWGALVAQLAGIPTRIGYDLTDVTPYLTEAVPFTHEHAVLQNVRLLHKWVKSPQPEHLVNDYLVHENDRAYVNGYLSTWGVPHAKPIFCIHPGTGTAVKHWTEAGWAQVADILTEQLNAQVVFTGSEKELALVRRIIGNMKQPAVITAGDTGVGQLAALFRRAKVVLGPDSGPLHLAAAVQTPTVTLFGPADPVEFGPWGSPQKHMVLTSDIGCRPCRVIDWSGDDLSYHPCVREITVARVLDAARRVVQST